MPCHDTTSVSLLVTGPSCHVLSRHVTSRHVTSRHVTSRHVTSRHVTSRHVTSRHVTSRHVTSRHVTSSRVTSCRVTCQHYAALLIMQSRSYHVVSRHQTLRLPHETPSVCTKCCCACHARPNVARPRQTTRTTSTTASTTVGRKCCTCLCAHVNVSSKYCVSCMSASCCVS